MELSLEEAIDVLLELIGCGIVVLLLQILMHSQGWVSLLERLG